MVLVVAKPVTSTLEKPIDLKEGGTLNLTCRVWGWPPPQCTWIRKDKVLSPADPGVSLSNVLRTGSNMNIVNGQLVISDMKRSDQTDYICSANNSVATTNVTAYIRVKGMSCLTSHFMFRYLSVTFHFSNLSDTLPYRYVAFTLLYLSATKPFHKISVTLPFRYV